MKSGILIRTSTVKLVSGRTVEIESTRFCSVDNDDIGAIRYRLKFVDFSSKLTVTPYVDADVENEDSNYDEKFWIGKASNATHDGAYVTAETKKTAYQVCTAMRFTIDVDGQAVDYTPYLQEKDKYAGVGVDLEMQEGQTLTVYKYATILSSLNVAPEQQVETANSILTKTLANGFDQLMEAQSNAWARKWDEADIVIKGDVAAQQGVRFNIFHLYQTYTGEDERLNIGPKGFTGEKYGGSTYWDTEAYCLPFYMSTADQKVAKNLVVYRYKHLQKAIENAEKLGFTHGAALYPMVTMTGEECHNEWEITFEEIHRNGAIAYGIYDYVRYTGDERILVDYGLEVLIAIARFWAQRVHFSKAKNQYVMHGVTGPNEYENNVNNNWYTNYIAVWCMEYAMEVLDKVKAADPKAWSALEEKIKFYEHTETKQWKEICGNMYFPEDKEKGIYVQADDFMDKELMPVSDLDPAVRPLNQNWSWDRILRSCFIKQADVLQGIYFFEDRFDLETIRRNFEFYEPMTVHESSLSPCVHGVLASRLNMPEKAYEMYLRTARLDLDDYNNDTEDGCHITSMAGTWMALVKGFGGLRSFDGVLQFSPALPEQWEGYSFNITYRNWHVRVEVAKDGVTIFNRSATPLSLKIYGKDYEIAGEGHEKVALTV